ncbi:MAG: CotH kinase family protein [Chitinispirillales bacterium]|jgi:hypothetical protein|nr:CotH kinase family protein [Chitinispirillales bacterium]
MMSKSGKDLSLIVSLVLICAFFTLAHEYSGTVVDQATGNPVEGVFVSVGHTERHTRTDANGRFVLSKSTSIGFKSPAQKGMQMNARWNFHRRTLDLGGAPGVTSAAVYSLNGKRLLNSQVPYSRLVSMPSLPVGIYILELKGDGGLRSSSRVVLSNKSSSFTFNSTRASGQLRISDKSAQTLSSSERLIFHHDNYLPLNRDMSGAEANMRVSLRPDERSFVFDQTKVREYRFTISSADSIFLENQGWREEYVPTIDMRFRDASASLDSSFGKVGLRYKGSDYSLPRCFGDGSGIRPPNGPKICPKVSFKVKFTQYDENKRFYGMKRVNLHSMNADNPKMRDMLAYELYREMGIHAPRTAYANVYVNNVHIGLFIAVEEIDGRFTKSRWPAYGDGNLYKEVWPTSSSQGHYLNGLETNNDPGDNPNVQRMVDFYNAINSSNEGSFAQNLSSYMDFDHFLRYMVVDVAINNWDGIRGWYSDRTALMWAGNHNFFIYEEENPGGKIWLVPWDLDNTFYDICPYFEAAGVPQWNETPAHCAGYQVGVDSYIRAPNCDKLTQMMAAVFWDRYVQFGTQFLNDQFRSQRVIDKINRHAQLISPHVTADPVLSHLSWASEVERLKGYIPNLAVKFSNHLHSIKSEIDSSGYGDPYTGGSRFLSPVLLNNFEFAPVVGAVDWVQMYYSQNSETSVAHNTQNPLSGTADLRFDFTFRSTNSPGAWDVWNNFQPGFQTAVDFSDLREIQITLRADRARTVRIALGNYSVYSAAGASSEYGWEITAHAEKQTLILSMLDLKYPDWADRKPDIKAEVLKSVRTLIFSPSAQMNSSGFLTADPDVGFLRVDNIRFVY